MIIINVLLIVFSILLGFHFLTKKYCNPYKLIFVFGKKGSGKSTLLSKLAYKYLKQGKTVYSTENLKFKIKNKEVTTTPLDPRNIYNYPYA